MKFKLPIPWKTITEREDSCIAMIETEREGIKKELDEKVEELKLIEKDRESILEENNKLRKEIRELATKVREQSGADILYAARKLIMKDWGNDDVKKYCRSSLENQITAQIQFNAYSSNRAGLAQASANFGYGILGMKFE